MIESIHVNFNFYSAQLSKDKKMEIKLDISLLVMLEISLLNFVSEKQTKIKVCF